MAKRTLTPAWFTEPGSANALWNVTRAIHLLETRLRSERASLDTWLRRLLLRTTWEASHSGPTQLPALRQMCASTHTRVLDLERELAQARVQLRALGGREGQA